MLSSATPLVSVIIPVYRVETYIAQCAESIFQQDWKDLDIIFVDNNSPDRSIAIIEELLDEKYPERKPQTRIIRETRQGIGYARAAGMTAARGEYMIQTDPDDWVDTNYISRLVTTATATGADMVCCQFCKEYSGKKAAKTVQIIDRTGASPETLLQAMHRGKMHASMVNKLLHRSLYTPEEIIIPTCNMLDDMIFLTQMLYHVQHAVFIPDVLYHYRRRHGHSITSIRWTRRHADTAHGLFHLHDHLPQTGSALDYIRHELLTRAGWYALSALRTDIIQQHPDAVHFLATMRCQRGMRANIFEQWLLKCYCKLIDTQENKK